MQNISKNVHAIITDILINNIIENNKINKPLNNFEISRKSTNE